MGKVIKFKLNEELILKRAMKEAQREFALLFKLTNGAPGLSPPWLLGMDEETYKLWESGDIEI
jgi:hypothetical protein